MLTEQALDKLIEEAREIAIKDTDRSLDLLRQVAATPVGRAWSKAHTELAIRELGSGNYQQAAHHALAVLSAPTGQIDPAARGVAGIVVTSSSDLLELPLDEQLLLDSIDACIAHGQPYHAAAGLAHAAHLRIRRSEREEAFRMFDRAVSLFDQSGSANRGPGVLHTLAKLYIEDGQPAHARELLDRGIARLKQFPYMGRSTRMLEEKLTKLRDSLGPAGDSD